MPRKTSSELKDNELIGENSNEIKDTKKVASKKSTTTKNKAATTTKKATSKAKETTKKAAAVKEDDKLKSTTKKNSTSKTKKTTTSTKAKETTKKAATKKTSTTKKATATTKKTASAKKSTTKKVDNKDLEITINDIDTITASTNLTEKINVLEYYDLPYRYNQTVVKVLAQTPTTLFIYWDISDNDRESFIKTYGDNFFNETKPVLIIHNNTMNYSFEIDIDDFANSWYLHVNDSNCQYTVELGRREKYFNANKKENHIEIPNNYLYITSSNKIDSPNDHILFDKNNRTVYFKDVKTNIITSKDITSISFLRNLGKIYNLYDLSNDFNEEMLKLDLYNNSSSTSSPVYK